jgi:endonuclease YncB( thermonuclease family)
LRALTYNRAESFTDCSMRSLLAFWKKDIINKLIVLVSLALAAGVFALIWVVVNTPKGRSLTEAFADMMYVSPTPTIDYKALLVTVEVTDPPPPSMTFVPVLPTFTSLPTFTPAGPQRPFVEITPSATATSTVTAITQPSATSAPAQAATHAPATPPVASTAWKACLPKNPPQAGSVVEIVDGTTVRVLIEKLVYVVRYIGVEPPSNKNYAEAARIKNSELTLGEDVSLIADANDKDDRGRLLRYVLVGDKLVNMELINLGLGSALDAPDVSCAQEFVHAEQAARASLLGMWQTMPTPTP